MTTVAEAAVKIRFETGGAEQELRSELTRATATTKDAFKVTPVVDAKAFDVELKRLIKAAGLTAEQIEKELKATGGSFDRLSTDFRQAFEAAGYGVDDLRGALDTLKADADAAGDALAHIGDKVDTGVQAASTGVRKLGDDLQETTRHADQGASVFANFAGNLASELPGISGAFGPLNVAVGQLAEYAADGNLKIANLGASLASTAGTLAPLAAVGGAVFLISKAVGDAKKRAEDFRNDVKLLRGELEAAAGVDFSTALNANLFTSLISDVNNATKASQALKAQLDDIKIPGLSPSAIIDPISKGEDAVRSYVESLAQAKGVAEAFNVLVESAGQDKIGLSRTTSNSAEADSAKQLYDIYAKGVTVAKEQAAARTAQDEATRQLLSSETRLSELIGSSKPRAVADDAKAYAAIADELARGADGAKALVNFGPQLNIVDGKDALAVLDLADGFRASAVGAQELARQLGFAAPSFEQLASVDLGPAAAQMEELRSAISDFASGVSDALNPAIPDLAGAVTNEFGRIDFGGLTASIDEALSRSTLLTRGGNQLVAAGFENVAKTLGDTIASQGPVAAEQFFKSFNQLTDDQKAAFEDKLSQYQEIAADQADQWSSIGTSIGDAIAPRLYEAVAAAIQGKPLPFKVDAKAAAAEAAQHIRSEITGKSYTIDVGPKVDTSRIQSQLNAASYTLRVGVVTRYESGGTVAAGQKAIINEAGTEGFRPFGSDRIQSLAHVRPWGMWTAPKSGEIIPADVFSRMRGGYSEFRSNIVTERLLNVAVDPNAVSRAVAKAVGPVRDVTVVTHSTAPRYAASRIRAAMYRA